MADKSKYGSFVATTNVYDLEDDMRTILVRLRQTINEIALSNNTKDTGYYSKSEFLNGQRWFPDPTLNSTTAKSPIPRQVYRLVVDFGALPNNSTKSVAHGLTIGSTWTCTRLYGAATDPSTSFIAIPYSSGSVSIDLSAITWDDTSIIASTDNISLSIDATNVNITTTTDKTGYTSCYVVIEYIKE